MDFLVINNFLFAKQGQAASINDHSAPNRSMINTNLFNFEKKSIMSFGGDVWKYMRARRKWWVLPVIIILLLLGLLLIFGGSSALAPFILSNILVVWAKNTRPSLYLFLHLSVFIFFRTRSYSFTYLLESVLSLCFSHVSRKG